MTIPALRAAIAPAEAAAGGARGAPDGRRHEPSFADLLETLAASRGAFADLVVRAAEAGSPAARIVAGLLDEGQAPVEPGSAGLLGPERSVPAPAAGPADAEPSRGRSVARVFNEDGFFTSAAAGPASVAPPDRPAASPGTAPASADAAGVRAEPRPAPAGQPANLPDAGNWPPPRSGAAGLAASLAEAAAVPSRASGAGRAAARSASGGPILADPAPLPGRPAGGRTKPGARVETPRPPAPAGSGDGRTAPVQVALRGEGAEASLVARIKALTPEEKARLRGEIAALLRRHGFGAATLKLNGTTEPAGRL